jgi:signal transduction histidine kinase
MLVESEAEVLRLRAVLRDLIALSSIPAAWIGREPPVVAAGLADTLIVLLQLDFVFVRLRDASGAGAVDVTRGAAWKSFPEWLERHVAAAGVDFTSKEVIRDDGETFRALVIPVGVDAEGGVVAAAAARTDFPTEIDQLLLSLAANQAATAFQGARLIHERKRAEEELRQARDQLEAKVTERTAELRRSEAHLAASRARIVTASDETRRRIERDLHDGVQQQLVSLAFELKAMEAALPADEELRSQLARTGSSLAAALEDLVEISRGIHPAILAEGGLTHALHTLAKRSAVPVELEVRAETRLPPQVEVAAYYVVSEALTNTAKHADASGAHVTVEAHDDVVELSIRDDGSGGADPTRGSGLIGLSDRVDALGGRIEVTSPVGDGTTLLVTLPTEQGQRASAVVADDSPEGAS